MILKRSSALPITECKWLRSLKSGHTGSLSKLAEFEADHLWTPPLSSMKNAKTCQALWLIAFFQNDEVIQVWL